MAVGPTGRIARAAARRPRLTIGLWLVLLTVSAYLAGGISDHVTARQQNLVTTESDRAADLDATRHMGPTGERQVDRRAAVRPAEHLPRHRVGVMTVAFASVASALLLLPAVLGLLGHRVNAGRVPTAHAGAESPRWRRVARRVVARPAGAALVGTGARAHVGGTTAAMVDEMHLFVTHTPWTVGFILLVTFALLLVVFRSVVIPLKAIVLNLLGTFATFGAVVAVYQWGWGRTVFGFPELDGMSPYMPVMIFALVFGLSMDYHVFLLTRVRERYDATGDTRTAVIEGLTRTGPLITGAAVIMVAVFGGFAGADIPELSQWGFGLAFGVLLDATVIRVLLVPAAMVWLGRANWYLPPWLGWLPRLTVETPPGHVAEAEDENEPALV